MCIFAGALVEIIAIIRFSFLYSVCQIISFRFSSSLTHVYMSIFLSNFISFSESPLLFTVYITLPFPSISYALVHLSFPFDFSALNRTTVVSESYMADIWETHSPGPCYMTSDDSAARAARHSAHDSHDYLNRNLFLAKT